MAEVGTGHRQPKRHFGFIAPYTFPVLLILLIVFGIVAFLLQYGFPTDVPGGWNGYLSSHGSTVIRELFSWRLLRHLLVPGLVGAGFAWFVSAGVIQHFYRLSNRRVAIAFLRDVVLNAFIPARWLWPSFSLPRKPFLVLAAGLSLLSLGLAAGLSVYGLFWTLEPRQFRFFQLLVQVLVVTWTATMLLVLVIYFSLRLLQRRGRALSVDQTKLKEERQKHALLHVGGPGKINVQNSHAVAIAEHNGRISQVLDPGNHYLLPYEQIRVILSLQVYEHEDDLELRTSDGIGIRTRLAITYHIAPDDALLHAERFPQNLDRSQTTANQTLTRDQPYRYGDEAVRRAAKAVKVNDRQHILRWHTLPFPIAASVLGEEVSHYRLDELFFPNVDSEAKRRDMHKKVLTEGNQALKSYGLRIIDIRLGPLQVDDPVLENYLELWGAVWEKRGRIAEARGQATAIEGLEQSIGMTETELLRAIAGSVRKARSQNGLHNARPLVALRLIETLERLARQSNRLTGANNVELQQELQALRRHLEEHSGESPLDKFAP